MKDRAMQGTCRPPERVVLVTVDSARKDAIGAYGAGEDCTPHIDAIARSGCRVENAYSHGAGTPEAFPSIMCSATPPRTLGERNVRNKRTLAVLMKELGYKTAGFHSNPFLSSQYGYGEGFDLFVDGDEGDPSGPSLGTDLVDALRILVNKAPARDGAALVSKAKRWFNSSTGKRFLWVHFMDAHFPYLPAAKDIGYGKSVKLRGLWEVLMYRRAQYTKSRVDPRTRALMKSAYDACIRRVDSIVGQLADALLGDAASSLFVLTSDHGDAFWEHGYFGHALVYDEIIKVPLIFRGAGVPARSCYSESATLADIAPTVASIAGGDFQGAVGGPLFSQGKPKGMRAEEVLSVALHVPLQRRFVSLRRGGLKLIQNQDLHSGEVISEELYDLKSDPSEKSNVVEGMTHEAEALRTPLSRMLRPTSMSEEDYSSVERRLKALGYV